MSSIFSLIYDGVPTCTLTLDGFQDPFVMRACAGGVTVSHRGETSTLTWGDVLALRGFADSAWRVRP